MMGNSEYRPLTPEQIANWRRVLLDMLGPYALLMPVEQIEAFRARMQANVSEKEEKP